MNIRKLNNYLQEKATLELHEDANKIKENLQNLNVWLSKQKHLNRVIDDQMLLNFLRGSKHNLEHTKAKLTAYYSFKTIAPEIAQNLDPFLPYIQEFLRLGVCVRLPLPKNDLSAACTMFLRYGHHDPNMVTLLTVMKATVMMVEILIREDDNFAVSGVNVVWDMKGMQVKAGVQATPSMLKKCVYYHGKAYPVRLKAIHVLNAPNFAVQFLKVFKNFFPQKLSSRFYFYSEKNWKSVYTHVPKSIFPEEYGGDAGSLTELTAKWKKIVESYSERLLYEDKSNFESSVPNHTHPVDKMLDLEGSFQNLVVD